MEINKSVQIGGSVYDIERQLLDISRNYFRNSRGEPLDISTLKTGLFGWLLESQAQLAYDSILYKNLLEDEHFLNTAKRLDNIYKFATMYNFKLEMAKPASCDIMVYIKTAYVYDILQKTGGSFTIDKDTVFMINNIPFIPYSDINVNFNFTTADEQSVSAYYDLTKNNFDIADLNISEPYIVSYYVKEEQAILIKVRVFQLNKTSSSFIVNRKNITDNIEHTVSYSNNLVDFNVSSTLYDVTSKIDKYFGTENPAGQLGSTPYCNYELMSSTTYKIIFNANDNLYVPVDNTRINIDTFTTLGVSGNISYNGPIVIVFKNVLYSGYKLSAKTLTESTGGKNSPDAKTLKTQIMHYLQSFNEVITENDVHTYIKELESVSKIDNNKIEIFKIRDDIEKRIYESFILFRDANNVIIPTNTIDISIDKKYITDNSLQYFKKSSSGNYILIPAGTHIVMVKNSITSTYGVTTHSYSDYKILPFYDDNLFNEVKPDPALTWLDVYKMYSDKYFVYRTPFAMVINRNPFLRLSFYRTSLNDNRDTTISQVKNVDNRSFVVSRINMIRNDFLNTDAKNNYTIKFNINSNIDTTKVTADNNNRLAALALFYSMDENGKRNYFGFKDCQLENPSSISNPYAFVCNIASLNTADTFTKTKLRMYPIVNNVPANTLADVTVDNECYMSILVIYDRGINSQYYFSQVPGKNELQYNNSNLYTIVDELANPVLDGIVDPNTVLEVSTKEPITFAKNINSIVSSDIKYTGSTFVLKKIPIIGSKFIERETIFNKIISSLDSYESYFRIFVDMLVGNTTLSMKFFNSYGKSKYFSTGEANVYLSIKIILKRNYTSDLDNRIRSHIAKFMNNINEVAITKLSFSNLTTSLENTFIDDIDNIEYKSINDMFIHTITETTQQIGNDYIPEYLCVPFNVDTNSFEIDIEYSSLI